MILQAKLACHASNALNSATWKGSRQPNCPAGKFRLAGPVETRCRWNGCQDSSDFLQPTEFFAHVVTHSKEPVTSCCWPDCEEEFYSEHPSKRRDHFRSHTKEKTYSCPLCGTCFANKIIGL